MSTENLTDEITEADYRQQVTAAESRLRAAQEVFDQAQADLGAAKTALIELMDAKHRKTATYFVGNVQHKITIVRAERVTVDEKGLRKAVGARTFKTLLTYKVSNDLLRKAIQEGRLDSAVVAQYVHVDTNAPSVRLSTAILEADQ